MLTIDHLALHLPPGFEDRADQLARQVAAALAPLPVTADRRIKHLAVPDVAIDPRHPDHRIAGAIADGIAAALAKGG